MRQVQLWIIWIDIIPLCYEGRKMGGVTPIPRQRIRQDNPIISRIQSRGQKGAQNILKWP